jgi:hypothetical protein
MKKLAITLSLLAGATVGYSQGELNWSDYAPASGSLPAFSIEIFQPNPANPTVEQNLGNTANDLPAGSATYGGAPIVNGSGYEVGLYVDTSASAVQNDVSSGSPVATAGFTSGFDGRWDLSGSLVATVPGLASGTAVFVELAAWSTSGTATSYAQALVQGLTAGVSPTSSGSAPLGGGGSPPATPGTIAGIGITDFSVASSVPEPSTIALGVIGASTFLMRLRRKQ